MSASVENIVLDHDRIVCEELKLLECEIDVDECRYPFFVVGLSLSDKSRISMLQ